MFAAAMIAAAPYCDDAEALLKVGLSEIPRTCRLGAEIAEVLSWRTEGLNYDEAVARIHARWDEHSRHDWCHTNSNAAIFAVALLWGEGDFQLSICRAVQPGFDTDCNGATVGSIMGMMLGAGGIPAAWTDKIHDTLKTSLAGYNEVKILADRAGDVRPAQADPVEARAVSSPEAGVCRPPIRAAPRGDSIRTACLPASPLHTRTRRSTPPPRRPCGTPSSPSR